MVPLASRIVDRVWFGRDGLAKLARAALMPFEGVYGSAMGVREALYDSGLLPTREAPLPTLSVGNISVGGTGKTPVAAWLARGLVERGARPAIVLRGYGADEPLVHRTLNPDVAVIVGADRVAGVARARAGGADVAVLDDAFQHRRIRRMADLVLVSADCWTESPHLLPAGPWREPLRAVRRATLIVVTRKAAPLAVAERIHEILARLAPGVPRTSVLLEPAELMPVGDPRSVPQPLSALADRDVHLLAAIADPRALVRQLEAHGARVTAQVHPDHHHFTDEELARFAAGVPSAGLAVCTLKDAVKVAGRWPRAAPGLWYVSQRVSVERGIGGIDRVLDDLVRARVGAPLVAP